MSHWVDPAVMVAPLPNHSIRITDRSHLTGLEKIRKNAEKVSPCGFGTRDVE